MERIIITQRANGLMHDRTMQGMIFHSELLQAASNARLTMVDYTLWLRILGEERRERANAQESESLLHSILTELSPFTAATVGRLGQLRLWLSEAPVLVGMVPMTLLARCPEGLTLLHHAAFGRSLRVLRFLIMRGADLMTARAVTLDLNRFTVLHIAAASGFSAGVALLLRSPQIRALNCS